MNTAIKLIVFSLSFLFFGHELQAQNIAGEWNGVISQDEGGLSDQYYFSFFFEQKGTKITGFSKMELFEGKKRVLYARKKLEGTFDGKTLIFKEVAIIEEEALSASNTNICLITGKLTFAWDKSTLCLIGTWGGATTTGQVCAPGKIKVCTNIPIALNKN